MTYSPIDLIDQVRFHLLKSPPNIQAALNAINGASQDVAMHPAIVELKRGLETGHWQNDKLLQLSTAKGSRIYVGFLKGRENKVQYLEGFQFEPYEIAADVSEALPQSRAMPVLVKRSTLGFHQHQTVALFEDAVAGLPSKAKHPAFYFVDRFVRRIKSTTRDFIRSMWDQNEFELLMSANDESLLEACAVWVHLHEYFHGWGALPFLENTQAKNSKSAGGFEELRVDVEALISLASDLAHLRNSQLVFQVILTERVFRYALDYAPETNLDARASLAALHHAENMPGVIVKTNDGRRMFDPTLLMPWLMKLQADLTSADAFAAKLPRDRQKAYLESVLEQMAGYDGTWHKPDWIAKAGKTPEYAWE
ncbi:MAG: hypothetical protein AAGF71_04585 [Pseudomonadota bacterium]